MRTSFKCIDCRVDTSKIGEYYVVRNSVWKAATSRDERSRMLCIGCLECRLKRQLTCADFEPCDANEPWFDRKSARMLMRLDAPAPPRKRRPPDAMPLFPWLI
jgi:hypothetical protein